VTLTNAAADEEASHRLAGRRIAPLETRRCGDEHDRREQSRKPARQRIRRERGSRRPAAKYLVVDHVERRARQHRADRRKRHTCPQTRGGRAERAQRGPGHADCWRDSQTVLDVCERRTVEADESLPSIRALAFAETSLIALLRFPASP
jgi:hypothetical protein